MIELKLQYGLDNISEIMEVKEENLPSGSLISGIYFIYDKNKELIYIGKALTNIKNRLSQHFFLENSYFTDEEYNLKKREHYKYFAFSQINKELIKSEEKRLIMQFKPKFNIQYNDTFDYSLKYSPISENRQEELKKIYMSL